MSDGRGKVKLNATASTNNINVDESSRWSWTWWYYHSTFVIYWARPCWRRPTTWIVLSIVLSILIIILTPVSIRYTASPDYTGHFAPIDTRIIPVSNTLCQGLKLTVSKALSGYNASLYMLDSYPTLTGSFVFSIPDDYLYLKAEEYHYYYFYMNPGSNFTVSVCISTSTRYGLANFYVLKGQSKFKDWQNEPFEYDGDGIYAMCGEDDNDIFTHQVTSEDYYYLVFSAEYYENVRLIIKTIFYRTLYIPVANESTDVMCSMSVGTNGDSCAVDVPLSGKTAFVFVEPQSSTDINWETGVDLDATCVPRIMMYSVIALSILVGLIVILVPILTLITIKCRKKVRGVVETDAEIIENCTSSLLPST